MGPRDHRIHLGRKDSPKPPPQIHSSTKSCFWGIIFWLKKVPRPKCWPDPSKISPEADFGNFSKSFQKERTANPREVLSRIHPSRLQTEPRGEKHIFCVFPAKIESLVLETQHLRIIFGILDPPGMSGARNPTFTNYFGDFGPTWRSSWALITRACAADKAKWSSMHYAYLCILRYTFPTEMVHFGLFGA